MPTSELLKAVSCPIFGEYLARYDAIEMICLSTTDGFPVVSMTDGTMEFAEDTMAAASSTLYSVSNAISRQILAKPFRIAFIESDNGNIAFISIVSDDGEYVLSISANDSMNIGQLRVHMNRISEALTQSLNTSAVAQ